MFNLILVCFIFAVDDSPQPPPQRRRKFGSKVSSVTMSETDMMRRLIQYVEGQPPTWKKRACACSWKAVKCNGESQVTHLQWKRFGLSGNLTWQFLPPHVVEVNVQRDMYRDPTKLEGALSSTDLTALMEYFNVEEHHHHGVFGFTTLPAPMKTLILSKNRLEGPVDLTQLPPNMGQIRADRNLFDGTIDLSALPARMSQLSLSFNQLSGTLDLVHLPCTIHKLYLGFNKFEGKLDVSSLPSRLRSLDVSNNELEGDVDFTASGLNEKYIHLDGNAIEAVIYEKGASRSRHEMDSSVARYTPESYALRKIRKFHVNPKAVDT